MSNILDLEESLAHLVCGDLDISANGIVRAAFPTEFDGFMPFVSADVLPDLHGARLFMPRFPDDEYELVYATHNSAYGWVFIKACPLKKRHFKGQIFFPGRDMMNLKVLFADTAGRMQSMSLPVTIRKSDVVLALNGKRFPIEPIATWADLMLTKGDKKYSAAHVMATTAVCNWSVFLGEDGPRARFITDPIGVREAFRLRDIPPGRSRRAALLHWVSQHWRQRRDPSRDDMIAVREHLRGRIEFSWNGLRCGILPSVQDLRRNSKAA